jgi:hypothetical protein
LKKCGCSVGNGCHFGFLEFPKGMTQVRNDLPTKAEGQEHAPPALQRLVHTHTPSPSHRPLRHPSLRNTSDNLVLVRRLFLIQSALSAKHRSIRMERRINPKQTETLFYVPA